jgi:mannan endo-1,4-beta-mannosidase
MKVKKMLTLLSLLVLLSVLLVACKKTESVPTEAFIKTENGQFVLNGEPFRFSGTNNYYLHYKDEAMIDDVIENAKAMGLKSIRCWAFLNGTEGSTKDNNAYMQTAPGVFDQIPEGATNGFESLDYALKKASEEGIYLILVFANNWDAFGGINQYVEWSETAEEHDDFYTDESCKTMYKATVENLINRKNSLTQIIYKNDPTIMAWELMNEPRCESDKTGETLYKWTEEMSAYVKSLDPNHLLALGDEGFFNDKNAEKDNWAYNGYSGVDWNRLLSLPNIDFGTFHLYPEHWGDIFSKNPLKSGNEWIIAHAEAAKAIGKPVILEEYGIQKTGANNRDFIYESWTKTAYEQGIAGTLFWILSGIDTGESADEAGLYPDFDGFRVNHDGGRTDLLLMDHAKEMQGDVIKKTPKAFILAPFSGEKISEVYNVKVGTINYDAAVESMELSLTGVEAPFTLSKKGSLVLETYNYPLDGDIEFTITVKFTDGTVATDTVTAFVSNRKTEEAIAFEFTFDTDLEGFQLEAASQAKFGSQGVIHSNEIGGGALMMDAELSGAQDWQELRVINKKLPKIADCVRLEFDLYYLLEAAKSPGGFRPYVAGNPGFVKLGVDANNVELSALPTEEINGKTYAVQHVVIPLIGVSACSELYLSSVGNMIEYIGPIYLDNLVGYEEVFVE